MSADDVTGTEAAVLLVLMAEATAVKNSELKNLGPSLDKPSRDKLTKMGLIDVDTAVRPMTLELTDAGWRFCSDLMGGAPPARPTGAGKALFTVLAGLRRWLDTSQTRPAEIFSPRSGPTSDAVVDTQSAAEPAGVETTGVEPVGVEARIREAYARLAPEPGRPIRLTRLRTELSDIPRDELDDALVRLRRAPDVSLIPEENQKTLSDADHDAAVVVGNQRNHLLEIEL
ncbi:hypothetical protein [Rhodococcus sp. 14-2470-1a]|uniref:hypothetical protein n=1 Tax=Rhodococcus sp. 14-2470-1a TaxID=2023150 RepID=UPI000B9AA0DE|nr:hypothetical protein [Rhodococcus sp. 14-2470-1a]OZF57110.1 hypothetical protein CH292_01615 [Rhodococcus sp. 14-2470-1a]